MLRYVIQYKLSIVVAILIATLSLIPGSSMPDSKLFEIRFLDKIVHFSMYAVFGFVSLIESRCMEKCASFHLMLILVIFVISTVIEVLQATVVATRSAEWLDLAANFTGLLAGYFAYRIISNMRFFKSIRF